QIVEVDYSSPKHCASVEQLINEYVQDPLETGQPLREDVRTRLVRGLQENPTLVLLAQQDEAYVGIAVCLRGYTTFSARPALNIHDLAVTSTCRGQGVGSALLEAVEERARQSDCARLTLEVRAANQDARRLYERFGFTGSQYETEDGATLFCVKRL
ncbi:MAG: GNAT family N-acetyltransferase, partial [Planctomycetales bacterium]